jgi:hypothetical protein
MEKNKLIAEFMGVKPIMESPNVYSYVDSPFISIREDNPEKVMEGIGEYVKYHTSWDWLMPVLNVIEKMGATIVINSNFNPFHNITFHQVTISIESGTLSDSKKTFCTDGFKYKKHSQSSTNKIIEVYNSVVNFIEWYYQTLKENKID